MWVSFALFHCSLSLSLFIFSRKAFRALQEALKHKYLNWKIWENFLYVAMNLQEFQSAIYAVNRLLQLRSEKEVNSEVLLALVKAMHIMLKRDPESGGMFMFIV